MLINGEKYACEACVRGHRVSTCQHSDRPLTHINKKGRPVSQCQHCRGLRKSRASHVACDCGAKPHRKEDCADPKIVSDSLSDPGDQHACHCSHGTKCTCALKKELLSAVPEVNPPLVPPTRTRSYKKPRLAKAGSESSMTAFTNNRPKSSPKPGDLTPTSGLPLNRVPIPHSVAGNSDIARRSTDSLPLLKRRASPPVDAINTQKSTRISKSEHGSPLPRRDSGQLAPLDFTFPLNEDMTPYNEYFTTPFYASQDAPAFSADIISPTTEYPGMSLSSMYNTAPYNGFERSGLIASSSGEYNAFEPSGLATSSSGEVSDVGDYISHQSSKPVLSTTNSDEDNTARFSSSYPSFPTSFPQEYSSYMPPTSASADQLQQISPVRSLGSDTADQQGFDDYMLRGGAPPTDHEKPEAARSTYSITTSGLREYESKQPSMSTSLSHNFDSYMQPRIPPPLTSEESHHKRSLRSDLLERQQFSHPIPPRAAPNDLEPQILSTAAPEAGIFHSAASPVQMHSQNPRSTLSPLVSEPQALLNTVSPAQAHGQVVPTIMSPSLAASEIPRTSISPSDSELSHSRTTASPSEVEGASPGGSLGSEPPKSHGFTVQDAQKRAHPETEAEEARRKSSDPKKMWVGGCPSDELLSPLDKDDISL